jgi:hypothetical protein
VNSPPQWHLRCETDPRGWYNSVTAEIHVALAPVAPRPTERARLGAAKYALKIVLRSPGEEYRLFYARIVAHLSPIEVEEELCYGASEAGFEG